MAPAIILILLLFASDVLDAAKGNSKKTTGQDFLKDIMDIPLGTDSSAQTRDHEDIDCSMAHEGPTGTFNSPYFPDFPYMNNARCGQTFHVRKGHVVELTFDVFDVEYHPLCIFDNVTIHDGPDRFSPLLLKACGSLVPDPVRSTGRYLYLYLQSDSSLKRRGFNGTYRAVSAPCSESHRGRKGRFTSPGYPNDYGNNIDCGQKFQVDRGKNVLLKFRDFDVEGNTICSFDDVTIYDGPDRNSPILNMFCGSSVPGNVRSTGNSLYLYFHTDGSVTRRGFKGTFRMVNPIRQSCGQTEFDASVPGTVSSPNYPQHYFTNFICVYNFTAQVGKVVRLSFTTIEIEHDQKCAFDALEFYDGEGNLFMEDLCGSLGSFEVVSPGNVLVMRFRSDVSAVDTGFTANYSQEIPVVTPPTSNSDCGIVLDRPVNFIVGGMDTAIWSHPWQVWMTVCTGSGCWSCGGSIVARNWVITAAHCTSSASSATQFRIYAGSTRGGANRDQIFSVNRWFEHPLHNHAENDIALIEISGEFDLSSAITRAVCLATANDSTTFDDQVCEISGWGLTTEGGSPANVLQVATVTVVDREECLRVGNMPSVSETHLCAGYLPGGIDTCQGDSGGPLVCYRLDGTKVLAGITSFGRGCARPDTYGYYTRVSHYAQWIADTMATP